MEVSWNGGTPKSSISIRISFINHPFLGTSILGNPRIDTYRCNNCSGHSFKNVKQDAAVLLIDRTTHTHKTCGSSDDVHLLAYVKWISRNHMFVTVFTVQSQHPLVIKNHLLEKRGISSSHGSMMFPIQYIWLAWKSLQIPYFRMVFPARNLYHPLFLDDF